MPGNRIGLPKTKVIDLYECVLVIKQVFSERISIALTSPSLPKHPLLPMKSYEL